ncbi:hypothetical protein D6C83_02284 [Aureobasidium pullulans]|uniref:RING-type domain-containing protein n=1 Tax=Aureobasidium pullulans TaxID=5580 RepID=A0A4V4LMF4_AURPU|nr:hypothetical protein D6C83_02284 [Aureobasidium pullulans]
MNEETHGLLKRLQGQDLATLWINSTTDDVAEIEATLRAYRRLLRLLDQHVDDAPQTKMIEGAAHTDGCARHEPLQLQAPNEPILRETGDVHQPGLAYEKVNATLLIVSLFAPAARNPLPVIATSAEPLHQHPGLPVVRLPRCAPFRNGSMSRISSTKNKLSRSVVRLPSPVPAQITSKPSEDHLLGFCSPLLKRATTTRGDDVQATLDQEALTRANEKVLWKAREEAAKPEILCLKGTLELKMKTIACRVSPEKNTACDQIHSTLKSSASLPAGRPSPQASVEMLGSSLEPVPEHPRSVASSQTSSSPKLDSHVLAGPEVSWSSIWIPRDRANFDSATSATATSCPMPVKESTAEPSVCDVPSPFAKSVSECPGSLRDQTVTSTSLFSPVADSKIIKLQSGGPRELCPDSPSTPPYIENMSTDKWNEDCIVCHCTGWTSEIYRMACGHHYCYKYVNYCFDFALRDESMWPPQCCGKLWPNCSELKDVLEADTYDRVALKTMKLAVPMSQRDTCVGCSSQIPDGYVTDEKEPLCTECDGTTCIGCKAPMHDGACVADNSGLELF